MDFFPVNYFVFLKQVVFHLMLERSLDIAGFYPFDLGKLQKSSFFNGMDAKKREGRALPLRKKNFLKAFFKAILRLNKNSFCH